MLKMNVRQLWSKKGNIYIKNMLMRSKPNKFQCVCLENESLETPLFNWRGE